MSLCHTVPCINGAYGSFIHSDMWQLDITDLKSAFIYWWLGIRHAKIQINVSIRQVCHTATSHNPDVWDLSAYFIVRVIRRQHTVALQVRRALWRQPWWPRLVGTGSTLSSWFLPLWLALDRIVRVPLTPRKLVWRFKQHYNSYDINEKRRHYTQQKHRSTCVIS